MFSINKNQLNAKRIKFFFKNSPIQSTYCSYYLYITNNDYIFLNIDMDLLRLFYR